MTWKPIADGPRDGTVVDLWIETIATQKTRIIVTGKRVIDCWWSTDGAGEATWTGGKWVVGYGLGTHAIENASVRITHYMDRPAPPADRIDTPVHIGAPLTEILNKRIGDLEITTRACRALRNYKLMYLGDLIRVGNDELWRVPDLGRRGREQIRSALALHGLAFGMDIGDWQPPADG